MINELLGFRPSLHTVVEAAEFIWTVAIPVNVPVVVPMPVPVAAYKAVAAAVAVASVRRVKQCATVIWCESDKRGGCDG